MCSIRDVYVCVHGVEDGRSCRFGACFVTGYAGYRNVVQHQSFPFPMAIKCL
jgi:hypothetical protein